MTQAAILETCSSSLWMPEMTVERKDSRLAGVSSQPWCSTWTQSVVTNCHYHHVNFIHRLGPRGQERAPGYHSHVDVWVEQNLEQIIDGVKFD